MDAITRDAGSGDGTRAVVTGGAGFLDCRLCAKPLDRGFSAVAVDNVSTGNLRNIAPLLGHGDFHFMRHGVVSPILPMAK